MIPYIRSLSLILIESIHVKKSLISATKYCWQISKKITFLILLFLYEEIPLIYWLKKILGGQTSKK